MSDLKKYLAKAVTKYQGSHEEKTLADLLFDDNISITMGDQRLNSLAALTYNTVQCNNIFNLLIKSLNAQEFPWKTLYKAVMVYHTIVLFGSEIAVDMAVNNSRLILNLSNYNSAMISRTSFIRSSGGTDYGAPVRMQAAQVLSIIETDGGIRRARAEARRGQESLVPMGSNNLLDFDMAPPPPNLTFGQGVEKSIGAGFDLSAVPGMYEDRPDRYFDNNNDVRKAKATGDHQFTREAMNPDSLLDLAFGDSCVSNDHLPAPDYLPALAKQRELEALLAQQQEQLRLLQAQQQGQQSGYGHGSPEPHMSAAPPVPSHAPPGDGQQRRSSGGAGDFSDLLGSPHHSAPTGGYGYPNMEAQSHAQPYGHPHPSGGMGYPTQSPQGYPPAAGSGGFAGQPQYPPMGYGQGYGQPQYPGGGMGGPPQQYMSGAPPQGMQYGGQPPQHR